MSQTTERTLDWISRHDPASKNYSIRPLIGATRKPRTRVFWQPGPLVLDQAREGACVGHGWINEATSSPVRVDFSRATLPAGFTPEPQRLAFELYYWCRKNDEWAGENYDGTSVLAGAKGMKMLGLLREYRWCFGIQDVIDTLLTYGPVVLGIPWLDGMYRAPNGELRVTGQVVGGHCILAVGYDPEHQWADGTVSPGIALLNSWGADWGVQGVAWIRVADLARLLADRGEACVAIGRSYARTAARVLARRAALRVKALVGRAA